MSTFLYSHDACVAHDMGAGHPESPARLQAVMVALTTPEFAGLIRREAPMGRIDDIARMHPEDYIQAVLDSVPEEGLRRLDADTALCPRSGEAALRAVGALTAAVDAVMAGEADNAFCAVRPPGHHAEPAQAMGFCLFNNVAIAAAYAREKHGLERVAVVDFDVHHGNGTEAMFRDDPGLFYASTHQSPLYPGTGDIRETGVARNIVNAPLPPHAGSIAFREAFAKRLRPALEKFNPELLLVSAGFDAHIRDPLAQMALEDVDYAWVTHQLVEIAQKCCGGKLVSALEGGYDLSALATASAAHVRALMAGNGEDQ